MKPVEYKDIKDGDFLLMYYGWGKMRGKIVSFGIFREKAYNKFTFTHAVQLFTEYNKSLAFLEWQNEGCLYEMDEVKASHWQFFLLTEEEFMLESEII